MDFKGFKFLRAIFLLICIVLHLNISAQNELGLKFGAGVSRVISKNYTALNYRYQKFLVMPSINFGIFYSINNNKGSSLVLESLFQLIEGKEKNEVFNQFEADYAEVRRDLLYFGIPLSYKYRRNILSYSIGAEVRCLLLRHQKSVITNDVHTAHPMTIDFSGKPRVGRFNYGVIGGVSYHLKSKTTLEATYFYGLNNIYHYNSDHPGNWKVQQLIMALKYNLH
jgi:opacity protein-like surface antigen